MQARSCACVRACQLSTRPHLRGRVLGRRPAPHDGQDVAAEQHLHRANAPVVEAAAELRAAARVQQRGRGRSAMRGLPARPAPPPQPRAQPATQPAAPSLPPPPTVSLNGSQLYTRKPLEVPTEKQPWSWLSETDSSWLSESAIASAGAVGHGRPGQRAASCTPQPLPLRLAGLAWGCCCCVVCCVCAL